MATLMRGHPSTLSNWPNEGRITSHKGLLIAGATVVGLGLLAWTFLGADFKRYMKIQRM
jgi:purine-cytosine permease-like protein